MRAVTKGWISLLLLVGASGGESLAQVPSIPLGLVTCQATAVPPMVRAEGIAELIGDIVMACVNNPVGGDPGINTLTTNMSVSLNVNITNNIDFDGNDVVDAVLIVNENNCDDPSDTGSTFGSCGTADDRFQDPQLGRLAANNRIEWDHFALPVPGTSTDPSTPVADCDFATTCFPQTTTLRLTGVRGNASQLGVPGSATFPSTQITAFVSITGPITVPVTNNVLNVGVPIQGVSKEISGLVDDQLGIVVSEQFSNMLLPLGAPVLSAGTRLSESGYSVPGSNNGAGASSGTRLLVRIFNITIGSTISVPRQIEYGSPQILGDAVHLSLVPDADADGAGGSPTVLTGQHDVTLSGGFGRATYEVIDASPAITESVVIPVTFGAGGPTPAGQVSVTLGPISTVTVASDSEPEPRFLDNGGDPQPVSASPGATTPVSARLQAILQDDSGEFSVSVGGTEILNGPVGSFGSTDVARGTTVAVAVSGGVGTSILNYETKITCAGGGLTQPVIASFADTAPAPRSLSLDIPAGGGLPVECSVLNRNTSVCPPVTEVDVKLTVLPDLDPGMFQVSVHGFPLVSGGDGAMESTAVEQGDAMIIAQTAMAGTTLTDYGTTIVCLGGGLPGIAAASFPPGDVQARSLTFDAPPNNATPMQCDVRNLLGDLPTLLPPIPGLLTTCVATAVPPVVRAEGMAELTGDIVLVCTAPAEPPAGIANVPATIGVSLNVNTTSNIDFGEGASVTDAVLVVNENNCTTPSAIGSDFTCGPDLRFQAPQYGKLVAPNRIEWQNFTFPIPGATPGGSSVHPAVTTLRIAGMRAQASQFGIPDGAGFPSTQVTAFVSINGATVPVTNNVLNVAVPISGLAQQLTPGPGADMDLTVSEGFATAFKTTGSPSFLVGRLPWEAGYHAPGSNGGGGASSGTRILVRFFGLDAGAAVSIPRQIDTGSSAATEDGLHLALVTGHDSSGAGGVVTALTGNENVPLIDGGGSAIYEVLDAQPFVIDQITIPISFDSGDIGIGGVSANFAAIGTETEASAAAPEPRFLEGPILSGPPFGPAITNPTISAMEAAPGELVTVTADIVDADPGVAAASVIFRSASFVSTHQMGSSGGAGYSTTIDTSSLRQGIYSVEISAVDGATPGFRNTVATGLQLDLDCGFDFSPKTADFSPAGGSGDVEITWTGDCSWFFVEFPFWFNIASRTDNNFSYTIDPNLTDSVRQGEVVLGAPGGVSIGSIVITQVAQLPPKADGAGTYSNGVWLLDANGNGAFDAGTDRSFALGFPGAQQFVGDWNGDGRDEAGVYKDGFWFLDFDGDDLWDGGTVDKVFPFGWIGATPVVGDWNGDGATDVGVYNNGFWFLDADGDRLWDGGVNDAQFGFGWPGVEILVGDWNGDGRDKVGVFSNGFWFLDYDGDTLWDGGTTDKQFGWGWAGVKPIIGDWNGDGRDKAGAWVNGFWLLDYDGDNLWDGGTTDRLYGWGASTAIPVIGDWDNDGADSAGAFLDGEWVLDVNGDALWDGGTVDQLFNWGAAGDEPVVGSW